MIFSGILGIVTCLSANNHRDRMEASVGFLIMGSLEVLGWVILFLGYKVIFK